MGFSIWKACFRGRARGREWKSALSRRQLMKDVGIADAATMDDEVAATEKVHGLGPKQSVGAREEAYAEHGLELSFILQEQRKPAYRPPDEITGLDSGKDNGRLQLDADAGRFVKRKPGAELAKESLVAARKIIDPGRFFVRKPALIEANSKRWRD